MSDRATTTVRRLIHRPEPWSLAILAVASAAGLAFLGVWKVVSLGRVEALDRDILLALRADNDTADPIGPTWLEELMRDVTALGGNGFVFLLASIVIGYLLIEGQKRLSVFLVGSMLGGLGLSLVLKQWIDRPRPDLVTHGQAVITQSFPSMHTVMSTVCFLTIAIVLGRSTKRRRLRTYLTAIGLVLAVLVGFSRVYLGVHWPTDVLAGWTLGASWALLCFFVARHLQRSAVVEPGK